MIRPNIQYSATFSAEPKNVHRKKCFKINFNLKINQNVSENPRFENVMGFDE